MAENLTKKCIQCGKKKPTKSYIVNNNQNDNLDPFCTDCRKVIVVDEDSLKDYCSQSDRGWNQELFKKALEDCEKKLIKQGKDKEIENFDDLLLKSSINYYFSKMNLPQNENNSVKITKTPTKKSKNKIDEELIIKWGKWNDLNDYLILEDFCARMQQYNRIETPQDEFYLKKLAVISLKMDKELEKGSYNAVKQLGDLFSKYMADSKFRASDLSDASKTGGLRTFSQIYTEVEKDGFIPPWEEYRKIKGLTQDIVDKSIMHILNYTLKLNKIPQMIEPPNDTPKIEDDLYD